MMTRSEALEQFLYDQGVEVEYIRLCEKTDGLYLADPERPAVLVAPDLSDARKFEVLAHEAGHHFSGLSGFTEKDEARACRWAVQGILSPPRIIYATLRGCSSFTELAELCGVEPEFVREGLRIYRQMHGEGVTVGRYYLNLYPVWVRDIKTGRIWPEE